VILDIILGIEDILISWFLIILVLLDIALLFVCCLIHCNLNICVCQIMSINTLIYLLTYLMKIARYVTDESMTVVKFKFKF